jgi:energy-coupling factor transporter ATP-binding protein EcfA2
MKIRNERKKNYEYNNFSNGQKKRIDLAILMSFIDLAKRKNSINTNLLILDEVLDSSLDEEGINSFMIMLNMKIKNKSLDNIHIITHKKDLVIGNYNKFEIIQSGEFSAIKQ